MGGLSIALSYRNPIGQDSVIATAGQRSSSDVFRRVQLSLPGTWDALIGLPPDAASPTVQALGVLDVGLILTVLLFTLLVRMAKARERAQKVASSTSAELAHRSLHDQLTGLPNRDLIFDRAGHMLARSKRDLAPLAAFYIDLDNFKAINESLGHATGDHLLRAIALRRWSPVRASDTLGRVGGDQFVVLADAISINEGPDPIARKLLGAFAQPFSGLKPGTPLRVSATFGVARGQRDSAAELIRDAGIALNAAKSTAKGRCLYFEPETQTAARGRLDLELDLRMAVEQNQFVVYQPIFRLHDSSPAT